MIQSINTEKIRLTNKHITLVCLGLTMACRSVVSFFNKGIKKSGLTIQQLYCLYVINEYRGNSMGYIAHKLYMDRSTMTRQIKGIKKYVVLNKQDDKRFFYLELTQEGVELLEKWLPKVLELEQAVGIFVNNQEEFIEFIHRLKPDDPDMIRSIPSVKNFKKKVDTPLDHIDKPAVDSAFDIRAHRF